MSLEVPDKVKKYQAKEIKLCSGRSSGFITSDTIYTGELLMNELVKAVALRRAVIEITTQ